MAVIQPLFEPSNLDFSPEVADLILEKLSFGFDEEFVWNMAGAPTVRQLRDYIVQAGTLLETFTDTQKKNLQLWLDEN